MSDADHLRSQAQLCFDIAQLMSDRVAVEKVRSEAFECLALAGQLDALELAASPQTARRVASQ
jgi:hypothetical protein